MKLAVALSRTATARREGWASFGVPADRAPRAPCVWKDQFGQINLIALGRREGDLQEVLAYGGFVPGVVYFGETLDDKVTPPVGFHEHPSLRGQAAKLIPTIPGFVIHTAPILESNTQGQQVWFMKFQSLTDPGTFIRRWTEVRFMDPVVRVKWAIVYSNLHSEAWQGEIYGGHSYDPAVRVKVVFESKGREMPLAFGLPLCGIELLQIPWESDPVEVDMSEIFGIALKDEWVDGFEPGLRMEVDRYPEILGEAGWESTYQNGDSPLRMRDYPPGTGDTAAFGTARGTGVLQMGDPRMLEALHVGTLNEFRRNTHFLEDDGTELKAANHPGLKTLGTAPDFRFGPDRLGKPNGWWPTADLAPHDSGHLALTYAFACYQFTCCPLVRWILSSASEMMLLHKDDGDGLSTNYSNPRAVGRAGVHFVTAAALFGDKREACIAKAVRALEIYAWEILDARQGEIRTLQPTNDPRLIDQLTGFALAWFPWQDCIASELIYALLRVEPSAITDRAKDAFRLSATSILREGFFNDPITANVQPNWCVGYRDGEPVGTQEWDTGWEANGKGVQRVISKLAMLTDSPVVHMAARNPFGNLPADVVDRARLIIQGLPITTQKEWGWLGVLGPIE